MRSFGRYFLVATASVFAFATQAQTYPAKPIRVIVTSAPGSIADSLIRLMAPALSAEWSQPIVIENNPGASGVVGTEQVARAPNDGYTLGLVASNFVTTPHLYRVNFKVPADFTPISMLVALPVAVFANSQRGWNTLSDLVGAAKARPGTITYASAGSGSTGHLAGELMRSMAEVNITHVPYKALAQAVADTVSGNVALVIVGTSIGAPHVGSGKLRALAVTGGQRAAAMPEVPTVSESGLPGYELTAWLGAIAPAGVAPDIVRKSQFALTRVLRSAELAPRLEALGVEVIAGTSEQFAAGIERELPRWGRLVRESGAKLD